ncbi:MAG TPA: PqqD family protein, partial [Dehalococcoidia bacterium]|nr:PqqD family protein [Dehalococcoidia bacterium]
MKFVVSNDAISQEVSGEMVILDLTSELYFGLNNTGLRIWQLLEAGKNTGEVLAALLLEFDVPSEQLRKDRIDRKRKNATE